MEEINVRNILVVLGPSNALELLDALEDAQLEEKRLTAARAATIISAAKVATYTHVYLLHAVYCQTLLASQLDFVT